MPILDLLTWNVIDSATKDLSIEKAKISEFKSRKKALHYPLTVSRLEDDSVFTQYLFHNISRSFLSNADLKYATSNE